MLNLIFFVLGVQSVIDIPSSRRWVFVWVGDNPVTLAVWVGYAVRCLIGNIACLRSVDGKMFSAENLQNPGEPLRKLLFGCAGSTIVSSHFTHENGRDNPFIPYSCASPISLTSLSIDSILALINSNSNSIGNGVLTKRYCWI